MLALLLVLLFSMLGPFIRHSKHKIITRESDVDKISKPIIGFLELLNFIYSAIFMLLIMTYNLGVFITLMLGYVIGYLIWNVDDELEFPNKDHSI